MKLLLCQISLTAMLYSQVPLEQAKQQALCEALQKHHTYIEDSTVVNYVEGLASHFGEAKVRIVDDFEPWAESLPCRVVLLSRAFLQKAASEQDLAQTIAHMMAHLDQPAFLEGPRIPMWIPAHHPRALVPMGLKSKVAERETEADRRAAEWMATFTADPESAGLREFQARYKPKKKPTLLR